MSTSINSHLDHKLADLRKVPSEVATLVTAFCQRLQEAAQSGNPFRWCPDRSEDSAVFAQLGIIHNTLLGLTTDYLSYQKQAAATYHTAVKKLLVHLPNYKKQICNNRLTRN